jgi:hypothetical protein
MRDHHSHAHSRKGQNKASEFFPAPIKLAKFPQQPPMPPGHFQFSRSYHPDCPRLPFAQFTRQGCKSHDSALRLLDGGSQIGARSETGHTPGLNLHGRPISGIAQGARFSMQNAKRSETGNGDAIPADQPGLNSIQAGVERSSSLGAGQIRVRGDFDD